MIISDVASVRRCIKRQQSFGQSCVWSCFQQVLFLMRKNLIPVNYGECIGQVIR